MLLLNPSCKLGGVGRDFIPNVDNSRQVDVESPLSLPPTDESRNNANWDSSSERDSGTGDSKKSSENVDTVDVEKEMVELDQDEERAQAEVGLDSILTNQVMIQAISILINLNASIVSALKCLNLDLAPS